MVAGYCRSVTLLAAVIEFEGMYAVVEAQRLTQVHAANLVNSTEPVAANVLSRTIEVTSRRPFVHTLGSVCAVGYLDAVFSHSSSLLFAGGVQRGNVLHH